MKLRIAIAALLFCVVARVRAEEAATFTLADGRRVTGQVVSQREGRVTIRTERGPVSFPEWLVARGAQTARAWAFSRRVRGAEDPLLLAHLKARRAVLERERKNYEPPEKEQALLKAKRLELATLRDARDVPGLRELIRHILAEAPDMHDRVGRDLLSATARAAAETADALSQQPDRQNLTAAAALLRDAYVLRFSGHWSGAPRLDDVLERYFKEDPRLCTQGLVLMAQLENFEPLLDAYERDWRTVGGAPRKDEPTYRITPVDGEVRIQPTLPESPDGIGKVEKAGVVAVSTNVLTDYGWARSYKSVWRRLFWCPVARQWQRRSVPARILTEMFPVCRHLESHLTRERRLVGELRGMLRSRANLLDRLSGLYEPQRNALRWHALLQRDIDQLNELTQRIDAVNGQLLRYRLHLQPAFERMAALNALMMRALEGNAAVRNDPLLAAPPKQAAAALLVRLDGFDTDARREALKQAGLRPFCEDPAVVARLLAVATGEFTSYSDRRAAFKMLAAEGNTDFLAWLKVRLMTYEEPVSAWYAEYVQAHLEWWERLLRKHMVYRLQEQAFQVLCKQAKTDDEAAALLRKLAREHPLPASQGMAVEALVQAGRHEEALKAFFEMRYPSARKRAARAVEKVRPQEARALQVLLTAQAKADRTHRPNHRYEPAPFLDKTAFVEEYERLLVKACEEAKLPESPETAALLAGLRKALEPLQLSDDHHLEQLVNRGDLSICGVRDLTPVTLNWLRKLAADAAVSEMVDMKKVRILLGEEETVAACLAQFRDADLPEPMRGWAVGWLAASADPDVAAALAKALETEESYNLKRQLEQSLRQIRSRIAERKRNQ